MVTIPVGSQNKPVEYLTRRFAINYNLPALGKITSERSFPNLSTNSALALAAMALLKLRVAEMGVAQQATNEWNAELAEARALADTALLAVSASHAGAGNFPTPARISSALTRYAKRKGNASDKWSAPGNYDANAFSAANTAPVAAALTPTIASEGAINVNLLSGATDAEGDALVVESVTFDGETFNWEAARVITVLDSNEARVELTMTGASNLVGAANVGANTIGPITASIYDGRSRTNRNLTITVSAPA